MKVPRPPFLCELLVPLAVRGDAVEAYDGLCVRVAPFVHVQEHALDDTPAVQLEVVDGDIASLEVDAVANAANDHLWMGAGVAGALKRAGGDEIEREAMEQAPIPVGTAVATSGGRLPARYVIHGAVMGQDLRTTGPLVGRTTHACLALADELGCASIALPAFGTGVGGFPLEDAAQLMVDAVRQHRPGSLERVVFAVHGAAAERAFRDAVQA
jgi:O-acetyl-ADP-ribose deacetylase